MLTGTVPLNYMNTNVVYIFFSNTDFSFAQYTLAPIRQIPNI